MTKLECGCFALYFLRLRANSILDVDLNNVINTLIACNILGSISLGELCNRTIDCVLALILLLFVLLHCFLPLSKCLCFQVFSRLWFSCLMLFIQLQILFDSFWLFTIFLNLDSCLFSLFWVLKFFFLFAPSFMDFGCQFFGRYQIYVFLCDGLYYFCGVAHNFICFYVLLSISFGDCLSITPTVNFGFDFCLALREVNCASIVFFLFGLYCLLRFGVLLFDFVLLRLGLQRNFSWRFNFFLLF